VNSVVPSIEEKFEKPEDSRQALFSRIPLIITRDNLINRLNFIHFQNECLLVYFNHTTYNRNLVLRAMPKPCLDNRLDCIWVDKAQYPQKGPSFHFQHFLLIDKQKAILVEPELLDINDHGIRFMLPETCREISSRQVERGYCTGVDAQLIQNSAVFPGILVDFCAVSFRIKIKASPPQRFQWINADLPVNITLSRNNEILYAGECRIIRSGDDSVTGTFVLTSIHQKISRFKSKTYRSLRHEVTPPPHIVFKHPLTGRIIHLNVLNLSGSGFSVVEAEEKSSLLPGLIIPEIELHFANNLIVKSKMQVIYRQKLSVNALRHEVKCGLVFLDMDIQDHIRLTGLLHQLKDSNTYICQTVDLDDLWHFFFETGFIYPKKYAFLQKKKEEIKETYKKVYSGYASFARHFTYQKDGDILGHMSMIRFFNKSWLIHHHAANDTVSKRAGLVVLDQIGQFSNDAHSLYTMHMDYLMCYFRPGNKFPSRVFGGAVRTINNPKACTIDTFIYFHCRQKTLMPKPLAAKWELITAGPEDLLELERFYMANSGGLMMPCLDLNVPPMEIDDVSGEYEKLGFTREKHLFSLKKSGVLKAVFMVNLSNVGLNLSDLTNCITGMILDQDNLPLDVLYSALGKLLGKMDQDGMPVLLFPSTYGDNHLLPYEKLYDLWILNTQYGDEYFNYINRLLRFIRE